MPRIYRNLTTVEQYARDVSDGLVVGVVPRDIVGYGSSSAAFVMPFAERGLATAVPYVVPTVATAFTLSCVDASDTAGGTGAQAVLIKYIDFTTRAEVSITVATNGLTPVGFTINGWRLNDQEATVFGSGGQNAGDIHIGSGIVTAGIPAVLLGTIAKRMRRMSQSVYTVPAGKTLEIVNISTSSAPTSILSVRLRKRIFGASEFTVPSPFPYAMNGGSLSNIPFTPMLFAEKTDLIFEFFSDGTAGVRSSIFCQAFLKDN